MSAQREAYDLLNKACRSHFWRDLKKWSVPWGLVWRDTWDRACSKKEEK